MVFPLLCTDSIIQIFICVDTTRSKLTIIPDLHQSAFQTSTSVVHSLHSHDRYLEPLALHSISCVLASEAFVKGKKGTVSKHMGHFLNVA